MEEHRKYIMDRFQEHLKENFVRYCERHGIDQTDDNRLLSFLIDQDLIPATNIQRYTVLKEFEQLYPKQDKQKTLTVNILAHRFSISERTVWSILKWVGRKKRCVQ